MTKARRYHPLIMLFDTGKLIKDVFFPFLALFIIKARSDSIYITYGRLLFFIVFGILLIRILLKWLTHKYELDDCSFHLYKGIFNKKELSVPFSKIQNINYRTTFIHRMLKVTSVSFETGMHGEEAAVKFEVISKKEAVQMEEYVTRALKGELSAAEITVYKAESNRSIHFQPSQKDLFKASFTSLSFLVIIPLLFSFYSKMDEFFHVEGKAKDLFFGIINSWWLVVIIVIVFILFSVAFGIVRTFLVYGRYEISSDHDRIYIRKGIFNETAFSIAKDRVQAIEIKQTLLKRLLGLAEVKLISAGLQRLEYEKLEVSSLYPFLPVRRAFEMITEILPAYELAQEMEPLPKKSLWVRLLRPSWVWILTTIVLAYVHPVILGIRQAWWICSAVLLVVIVLARFLEFLNTQYTLNDRFIQLKKGFFISSLFLSKRDKVIEVSVTRNILQKWLGLASIRTINRAKPVYHHSLTDIPEEFAESFFKWYVGRMNEIEIE